MIEASALWVKDQRLAAELASRKRYESPVWRSWWQRSQRVDFPGPEPDRWLDVVAYWGRYTLFPRHWPHDPHVPEDRTVCPAGPARRFRWQLRDYQAEALAAWRGGLCGVIQAPCGAGKTVIGSAALCAVNTPGLVLVHTLDLARQWVERLEASIEDAHVGLIGHGKDERDADIVIATFQTLTRWPFSELIEWGKTRGIVIVDECHHLPAVMMANVMMGLGGRYRLGLTATPERIDGLTGLLHDHLGPTVYQITAQRLQDAGATLSPVIEWLRTGWQAIEDSEPHERKRAIAESKTRNSLLLERVAREVQHGRRVLILCDLRDHCRVLAAALMVGGIPAQAVTGSKTSKQRAEAFEAMRSGALSVMVATSLADEGLDIPELDTVVLATPCSNPGRVEQRIGRALRPAAGKHRPRVIDLLDDWGPYKGYGRRRAKLYRERGWL